MDKEFIEKIKKQLEQDKITTEEQLSKFAKKDSRLKGDWDTNFPDVGTEPGDDDMEEDAAKKREEYERLLPIEYALEKKLQNISEALEHIKNGSYGICQKCGKEISEARIMAKPEVKFCINCEKE